MSRHGAEVANAEMVRLAAVSEARTHNDLLRAILATLRSIDEKLSNADRRGD